MKALIALVFVPVLGAGLLILAPVSQDDGPGRGEGESAEQDTTGDPVVDRLLLRGDAAREARELMHEERDRRIKALLVVTDQDSRDQRNLAKYAAIKILALHRAPEACELLIGELDLLNHPFSDGFGTASFYPVAAALVEIGMPAVRELYAYLRMGEEEEGEIPDERMRLAAWVLEEVYGSRRVARVAVEEEMKKPAYAEPTVQARFRRVLSIYDEEDRKDKEKAKEREEKEKERRRK